MDKDLDLKEIIVTKIKSYLKINSENKKNDKYLLKDLGEIKSKKISPNLTIFYHEIYKDVRHFSL
jgi:hypothetical protein